MRAAGVMAIMIAGYSFALWGYTLIRGYDVAFPQLVNPAKRWGGASSKGADYTWPPQMINDPTVLLPDGASMTGAKTSGKPPTTQVPPSAPQAPFLLGGGGGGVA